MATNNHVSSNASAQLVDLTVEEITKSMRLINSQASNPRLKFVMDKLTDHLHAFQRET